MKTSRKAAAWLITLFLVIEAVLCILVQRTTGTTLVVVSYMAVVLAFVFSLIQLRRDYNYILTTAGLLMTICADLFLVVLNPQIPVLAMGFFSITQICYFIRIYRNQESIRARRIHLITRVGLVVLAMAATVLVLGEKTDALSLISLFYYGNLLINTVFAFTNKRIRILAIGLLLFTLCDLFIGLNILCSSYIPLQEGTFLYFLANPGVNMAWIFYVPSQTLIAVSNKFCRNNTMKLN